MEELSNDAIHVSYTYRSQANTALQMYLDDTENRDETTFVK